MSAPESVGPGVYAVDSGYVRPELGAVHIVRAGPATYIVDTGTHASVAPTLAALDHLGIDHDTVSHVILTHIHLDHAGGAGALMQALPRAVLVVHPRGARHMADPTRLVAGSIAVYGEATFRALYGEIVAVPPDRIVESTDDGPLMVGDRVLRLLHTEGHARHHHCVVDDVAGGVFTGDSFGIAYRTLRLPTGPFAFPTTTPVHFDPDAAHASIDRIVATGHDTAWLTHYSRVDGLDAIAAQLHTDLDAFVEIAAAGATVETVEAGILDHLCRRAAAAGHPGTAAEREAAMMLDARLNAQGLVHWRSRQSA